MRGGGREGVGEDLEYQRLNHAVDQECLVKGVNVVNQG